MEELLVDLVHIQLSLAQELLERVREEANKYNVGIHIHMNETQKEINDVIEAKSKYGTDLSI